jgi:hypothetical protein
MNKKKKEPLFDYVPMAEDANIDPRPLYNKRERDEEEEDEHEQIPVAVAPLKQAATVDNNVIKSKDIYYVHGDALRLVVDKHVIGVANQRVVAIDRKTCEKYYLGNGGKGVFLLYDEGRALTITATRHRDLFMVLLRADLLDGSSSAVHLVPESAVDLYEQVQAPTLPGGYSLLANPIPCQFQHVTKKDQVRTVKAIAREPLGKVAFLSKDLDKEGVTFKRSAAIRLNLKEHPAVICALRAKKLVPKNTNRAMVVEEDDIVTSNWIKKV